MEEKKFTFELLVGDVVTRAVRAKNGTPLLDANTTLNSEHIEKLERWQVPDVWVIGAAETSSFPALGTLEAEDPIEWSEITKDPPPMTRSVEALEAAMEERAAIRHPVNRVFHDPEPFVYDKANVHEAKQIMHEAHQRAVRETKKVISQIARREESNIAELRRMIVTLVDNGVSNRQVASALTSLTQYGDVLLAHSVSTTVYAILTGYMMGFSREELYELAECCLLHDIGMSRVSSKIWMKHVPLNADEMLEIQKHTLRGADVLHDTSGISFIAELAAYQHHERFDGSGYPKGRTGLHIHEYSRIIAMVDAYTAMTSDRPWRAKRLGYEVMKFILASSNILFDPSVVKAFLRGMALYPIGSQVALSNGSVGLVVSSNPTAPYRPHVKVMQDENGRATGADGDIIDLMREREIAINCPIEVGPEDRIELWRAF